jgi:hypothetical protein
MMFADTVDTIDLAVHPSARQIRDGLFVGTFRQGPTSDEFMVWRDTGMTLPL